MRRPDTAMDQQHSAIASNMGTTSQINLSASLPPRMQYRSRPVTVAVDPVSLVISECIVITSALQKSVLSTHSSVAAILGGRPNTLLLSPQTRGLHGTARGQSGGAREESQDKSATNRWGLRGQKGKSMQDHHLLAGFGKLRQELAGVKDIYAFDAPSLLEPFRHIVQSAEPAASIKILALGALRKLLTYGFMSPDSPRFALAMQSLSSAITACQINLTDAAQVEVAVMILHLMEDMMSGPGGDILSDENVCKMMESGLKICSKPKLSPVLRRTAEVSMVKMCQIIFEGVKHLEVGAANEADVLDKQVNGDMSIVKVDASSDPIDSTPPESGTEDTTSGSNTEPTRNSVESTTNSAFAQETSSEVEGADAFELRPYSLASVWELFRVLVSFLDPHDTKSSDGLRVMALRIIHVALEVSGSSIAKHPALAAIAEDQLCCYLFQLVRSDKMAILQESLVVAGTLLATCRGVLKLQQELYLSYLVACLHPSAEIPREPGIDPSLYAGIPRAPKLAKPSPQASSGRSTPVPVKDRQKLGLEGGAREPDAKQAMVEAIGVLARLPTFMIELFVNYDCDENRADLCEDMVGLLSRNALPDSAIWSTTSVPPLCLDALLRYIQFIAERLDTEPHTEGCPDPADLSEHRRRKKIIIKGTSIFNENPKEGLAYLHAQGIISDIKEPNEVASFLKATSRVSKKMLGDFLSKKGNESILEAFIDLFDFTGKRVDEALRLLLESFRLPGESPLIARIVTIFSIKYLSGDVTPAGIADKDAVFILTYAIIMLNTDQHNPNLKASKRMTFEDFSRNLRGQNGGKDFTVEYLQGIFDTIKSNEIILPDEHDNKHAFDYAWRELLLKTEFAGSLIMAETNIYDSDMFAATWRPIVATLSYVFMSATDDAVFARVVTGFDECARIAAKYGLTDALDHIVYCLTNMSKLASDVPLNTSLNTEVQAGGNSVIVSELAVKLGRDLKAQLATVVLFRVVNGSEGVIKTGWRHIIRIWLNLFANSLIPPAFHNFTLPLTDIPLQPPSQVIDRASKSTDAGFFSVFTSYISSYAADDPPEPSDAELESALCTVDCINTCQMGDIFVNISNLPTPAVETLVRALLEKLPEENHGTVITIKSDNGTTEPPNGQKPRGSPSEYDPSVVFILEYCTVLACRDPSTIEAFAKPVIHALQQILRDASQHHVLTVSRASFYVLKLLQASYAHDSANIPVLLHTMSSIVPETLVKSAQPLLQGLKLCTEPSGPLRSEIMTSPDFWAIMRTLARTSEGAPMVLEIVERGVTGTPPAIIADNYEAAVSLLNDFAAAASFTTSDEERAESRQRKSRRLKSGSDGNDSIVTRGVNAINLLHSMTGRIPQLMQQSHLENSEAWSAYWLPIFEAFTAQCTNPCRDVRLVAFTSLQRSLLAPELTCTDPKEWTAIFGKVLFPLILKLLKPEIFISDRDGMSEMRVQAASLLCRVFLQYLVLLSAWDGMSNLWIEIIEIMDRLMNSGQGDSLEEAVRENLKNVVLFMSSSGFLVPPEDASSTELLWGKTWKRIDRFLPDLKGELGIEEPQQVVEQGGEVQQKQDQQSLKNTVEERKD